MTKGKKTLIPGNFMYTTLVTRTTHNFSAIYCKGTLYAKKLPSFLNVQNKCEAYLNSFSVLPMQNALLPNT